MQKRPWLEEQTVALKDDITFQFEEFRLGLAEQISRVMKEKEVSPKALALKLNCTTGHINRILNGERNMTLERLFQIATALGGKINFSPKKNKSNVLTSP